MLPNPLCPHASRHAECRQLSKVVHEMSESFGRAIDAKDAHTKNHSDEVAVVSHTLAMAMGLPAHVADVYHIAGHLHDVGKIGVPDAVLTKPGPLTSAEWEMVRKHPALGAAILSPIKAMTDMEVPEMVLYHHEQFNGSGYPRGLRGSTIPLGARIIAVADSVSAMLQRRPYREPRDFETVCREIAFCSGSQFDPRVVEAFLSVSEKVRQQILFTCRTAADGEPPLPAMATLGASMDLTG